MKERLNRIIERWFVMEPALFAVTCTHSLVENVQMKCPLRSGKQRIEYNPALLKSFTDQKLEEALKIEAIRIILKHPYERKPDQCSQMAVSIGSNIIISDNYQLICNKIESSGDFQLESGHPYEWYCYRIQEMIPDDDGRGDGGEGNGNGDEARGRGNDSEVKVDDCWSAMNTDLSEMWEEDDLAVANINSIIDNVKGWGSLAGKLEGMIVASVKATINWRNVFSGFRASILSSRRDLTRMRPNRRFGFEQMGSRRRFTTRLLVAVDVSGSISDRTLSFFYGVISSAFRYGFESVDVVQFDCGIGKVRNIKKVVRQVEVVGRGGTSFDEPIRYAYENHYDGLLILTDGYAPKPSVPEGFKTKIMWVCEDQRSYDRHHAWMEEYGRVCTMSLP